MSQIKQVIKRAFVLKTPIAYIVSVPCFVFVGIVLAMEYTGPLAYPKIAKQLPQWSTGNFF